MTDNELVERLRDRMKREYDTNCGDLGTTMDEQTAAWLASSCQAEIAAAGMAVVPKNAVAEAWEEAAKLCEDEAATWLDEARRAHDNAHSATADSAESAAETYKEAAMQIRARAEMYAREDASRKV